MENRRGILISIEGIDGSGKSTAARALKDALTDRHEVVLTKEPGATQLGKQMRELLQTRTYAVCPEAEYLLFLADRAQHFDEVVLPALKVGSIVISDRMADSSRAYQAFGRGLDDAWIKRMNGWAMKAIVPDLTIYLRIDYATAMMRLQKRNEQATVFEQEKADFFKKVIEGYETIFAGRSSVITIDACDSQAVVHKLIVEKVSVFLETADEHVREPAKLKSCCQTRATGGQGNCG